MQTRSTSQPSRLASSGNAGVMKLIPVSFLASKTGPVSSADVKNQSNVVLLELLGVYARAVCVGKLHHCTSCLPSILPMLRRKVGWAGASQLRRGNFCSLTCINLLYRSSAGKLMPEHGRIIFVFEH
eukprot:7636749-Pyramimonas_sp.AAC.1